MHPQDMRNLILFAVFSIAMWLTYDHFIARPHALELQKTQAAVKAATMAAAPAEMLDTAIVKPRAEILGDTGRVVIDTPSLKGSINLVGARLDDLALKAYFKTVDKKDPVELLSPARTAYPRYVETGWVAKTALVGLPNDKTQWSVLSGDKLTPQTPVTLSYTADGVRYEKIFSVDDDFGFSIENRITNISGAALTLHPYALVTEHGMPEDFGNMGVVHEGPIGYIDEKLHERDYKYFEKNPEDILSGKNGWIGLTGKYWLTALAPEAPEDTRFRFISSKAISEKTKTRYQTDITGAEHIIKTGDSLSYKLHVFSGPKKLDMLEKYEKQWGIPHFDLAVDFGWFYFLTKPFFLIINWLYGVVGNFGIAIILFTCILRVFIFPLANTSYKSFAKLRKVSPEMYEIRHKYKDDKVKLQQELVALYQRHNVNPMAGCLPIIVQIPIFFSLYKVLSNTIEMRHAPFFGWIQDLSVKDPTSITNAFGLLPWDAPNFLHVGIWPILMMLGMIVQKNLSPPPDDPIQARIMGLMPYMMTLIMSGFASGLVIYWTINNLLGIIQQMIIMRSMGVPIHLFSSDKDKKKLEQEIKEGPSVHPSLEMIEEEIEETLEGLDGKTISKPKPKKKKKK